MPNDQLYRITHAGDVSRDFTKFDTPLVGQNEGEDQRIRELINQANFQLDITNLSHSTLTDLTNNDHTQYILKSVLTTTGDILYASAASTPARLGVSTNGYILTLSGGLPTWQANSPIQIIDNDVDTYVSVEKTADSDIIEFASAGTIRGRLSVSGLQIANGMELGLYSDAFTTRLIRFRGDNGQITQTPKHLTGNGLNITPSLDADPTGAWAAIGANAVISLLASNAQNISGLSFLAGVAGANHTGILSPVRAGVASVTSAITASDVRIFHSIASALAAGLNITKYQHLYIGNPTGATATVVNQYGIYIEDLTKGTTLNIPIYSLGGNSRHVGGLTLGADAAVTSGYILDVRAGNARFEIGGVQKLDIQTGAVTVGVDGGGTRLILGAFDGTNEGGEVIFNGAAANADWTQDNYGGEIRWFTGGVVYHLLGVNVHQLRGYLNVAATATAPTNTTAGDITGTRLIVPDATMLTGLISQLGGPVGIPNEGVLRFYDSGSSNYIGIRANNARTTDLIYVLPVTDPTAGQILSASAPSAGVVTLSWAADATGAGSMATDTLWDAAGDLAVGTGANTAVRLALTVPAADIINVLGVVNAETTPTWKSLMDATVATTQAFGDAAAAGTGVLLARITHKHAMPANPVTAHEAAADPHTGYRLESADHTHASSGLQGGQIAGSDLSGVPGGELGGTWASPTVDATHSGSAHHTRGHTLLESTDHTDTLTGTVVDGDTLIGNVTPKWSRLAISIPAANVRNVFAVDNGELRPSWKAILDGTNPAAIGTVAPGTALTAAHRDHVHATGAGTPSTQAFGDAAAIGTGPAASMTDHKHAMMANPVTAHESTYAHGDIAGHIADAADAHDASAISILDTAADFTATDVEGALAELQSDNEAHVAAADPHTGYVLESLLDAKGDLIAASASDTPVRVAVGANDTILMADSAQASGVKWAAAATTAEIADVAMTEAAGTSDTYARGDHVHSLGTVRQSLMIVGWQPTTTTGAGAQEKIEVGTTTKHDFLACPFDSATAESAFATIPMPDNYDGSTVTFRVWWLCKTGYVVTSSDGVAWGLKATAYGDGDVIDTTYGTEITITDTGTANNEARKTADSAALTIGNTPAAGDLVHWVLTRKVADAADDWAADAYPIAVVIEYGINALSSV